MLKDNVEIRFVVKTKTLPPSKVDNSEISPDELEILKSEDIAVVGPVIPMT